jgi:Domain of unknown function (DUF4394)/PEP-CTERM motif
MSNNVEHARHALRLSALAAALLCAAAGAHAENLIGLTSTNALVTFDTAAPANGSAPVTITGLLGANETILGIDRRAANGLLYGLGSSGRIYTLNSSTGAATFTSVLAGAALSGTAFGVDFNPVADRLRVTSNAGQNLRIDVSTGAATVDSPLNGPTTSLAAAAYTNNVAGATTTTLYGISAATDTLYIQNPPNNGTLVAVGSLGFDTTGVTGFDISGTSGLGFAALTNGDTAESSLYSINLSTGAASLVGIFGIGGNPALAAPILGIALNVAAIPEPGTYALFAAGLLGVGFIRLRRRQHD